MQIQLLGELRLSRNGVRQTLPPSKKTRALLGYLLLTGRPQRREALCNLFWDVADDPRGALRWSLSKLRPLLDRPGAARLQATREGVAIDLDATEVDVLVLQRAVRAAGDFAHMHTDELERWASALSGELLEGLDLPDFNEFQAFCLAQREELHRLRLRILTTLSARLLAAPERELPHVRSWVRLDPLSLSARSRLLHLLQSSARSAEAMQEYQAARRVFEEHGSRDLAALERAFQQALRPVALVAERQAPELAPAVRRSRPSLWLGTGESEVIGRAAELSFLREQLRAVVRTQRPKLVALAGEAGSGKSHLLRHFASWAELKGFGVLRGAAHESERTLPFALALTLLQRPEERAVFEQVYGARAQLHGATEPARASAQLELSASLAQLFARRAREHQALCLVLEDAHWLDRASAELLHSVLRHAEAPGLFVVLSVRREEAVDNPALTRLTRGLKRDGLLAEHVLPALGVEAIAALLEAEGSDMDPERVAFQAGGNPLFALELARLGERPDDVLPESLAEAVRERLARLSGEASEALRWAAVLEWSFSLQELSSFAQIEAETLVSSLEQLERAALLALEPRGDEPHTPRYRFAHDVVRRVAYAELSPPRRQLMHARVARTLHQRADYREQYLSRLVRHATLAHDHALAAEAHVAAGTRCLRLFAYAEARALAQRGLAHCERLDGLERIRRSIELLEIELWCAAHGEATPLSDRIRRLGDEAHAFGAFEHARRAHKVLSYWHLETEAPGTSQHHSLMAELISRAERPDEQLSSLAEAGRCMLLLGREHERALDMLEQAAALATTLHTEPAVLRDGQGLWHAFRGELAPAARCFEQAAALANVERNRLVEFQALEHRTLLEFERRDFQAARRFAAALCELAVTLPGGSELPFARCIEAMAAYALDACCIEQVEEWLEQLRALEAHRRMLHALARLGELDVMHVKPARGLRHARETLELAELLERPTQRYVALSIIAHVERQQGNLPGERQALATRDQHGWREVAVGTRERMHTLLSEASQAWPAAPVG